MKNISRNILLAVISGVLGFLAFPPLEFTFLAWVCLVPLIIAVSNSSVKGAFWCSYLSGLVFFGGLLYWLVQVSIPGTVILVLVLAVFYGLFGLIAKYVLKHSMDLLILPFVWVILEYIRGNLFTGFPWGLLGYAQYTNTPLVQIADITGAYGVSFLIVAFNLAMFAVLTRSKKRLMYMVVSLIFIIMATSYGIYKFNNFKVWGSPRISVIQGNVPQSLKWDERYAENILQNHVDLTREVAKDKPDLIIWPETSYPYLVTGKDDGSSGTLAKLSAEIDIPILAGVIYNEGDDYYNSAMLFSGGKSTGQLYHKLHRVPFGEYVPFEKYISFLRKYIDKPIGNFGKGDEYTLFSVKSVKSSNTPSGALSRQTSFYKFGALICFEDIFPYLSRAFVKKGANFMVNMTNDAWFGDTGAPRQHLQSSVFRAIENRVPVIRSANTGVSCFVDSTGAILSGVEEDGKEVTVRGTATDEVSILKGMSFYTYYGDVFVYFCGFMLILLFVTETFLARKKKPLQE